MIRLVLVLSGLALAAVIALALVTRDEAEDGRRSVPPSVAEVVRRCDRTSAVRPPSSRYAARYLRTGRLTVVAFLGNFQLAAADEVPERRGAKVLKAPVVFTGAADLTLSVPRAVTRNLSLHFERGRPASRVRFEACPGPRGATGAPGEFLWTGPWPACVPLDVSGEGQVLLQLGRRCQHRD